MEQFGQRGSAGIRWRLPLAIDSLDMTETGKDADLLARMGRGERQALADLYDRFAPRLLALGVRMLGDRREAEDVVHDVFVETWHAARSYAPERGTVSSWMNLRMRSRCLDRLRSADRSRTIRSDDGPSLAAVPESVPPGSGDQTTVLRALESLSPEQRRVLELGYYAGMSQSEIAAVVGVSIGTVKSRTAAALQKLRTRLAEPGEGTE